MHITRRDVLRRLGGIATAATMLVSANFVLDSDVSSVVAGRQASIEGQRHSGTAPGRLRQTTTTAPSTTTGGSDASTTSPQDTSVPQESTSTITATTAPAPTTTVAPATTAAPVTTTTTKQPVVSSGDKFTIALHGSGPEFPDKLWNAPYSRSLPYTANVGWTDGDRHAYECAYMFLLRDGLVVGRVTFASIDAAPYTKVNDQSMEEKIRWADGTLNITGTNMGDCDRSPVAYEPASGDVRPIVRYLSGSDLLEIRDYTKTVVLDPRVTFNQVEVITEPFTEVSPRGRPDTVYSRVSVVGLIDGLPAIVVYYDSLHSSVAVTSDLP